MSECIFCKIINKEIPAKIIYEDQNIIAFNDINPQVKNHVLIVPKEHSSNVEEIKDSKVFEYLLSAAKKIAKELDISKSGYRLCLNTGPNAGQTVPHVHMHLLGGERLSDKMA
jgi:histidine triad (HIT) family protein